jgi:hypothetical protein
MSGCCCLVDVIKLSVAGGFGWLDGYGYLIVGNEVLNAYFSRLADWETVECRYPLEPVWFVDSCLFRIE